VTVSALCGNRNGIVIIVPRPFLCMMKLLLMKMSAR